MQKGYIIIKEQSDYLRKDNLIEGRYPNIYISSDLAKITNTKKEYKGLDNSYYKDYIYDYIKKIKSASRQEINDLIKPKLSQSLSFERLDNKVRYLLRKLREEKRIVNIGSDKQPKWIINNNEEK